MSRHHPTAPAPSAAVRFLLLALLPLVAVLVYLDSLRYDPGLLDFKAQKDGANIPANYFPQRWDSLTRTGTIRRFDKSSLYEYVNGHAEFFISAGFLSLAVADYSLDGRAEPAATMEIYHMGKPLHAFGVLMDETGEAAEAVNVGGMGFKNGRGLRFIHGPYYMKLSAFNDAVTLNDGANALLRSMGPLTGDGGLSFDFPDLGQVIATGFIKENHMGLDFLNNIIERTFRDGEQEIRTFLLVADKEEIAATSDKLLAFLNRDGIEYSQTTLDGLPLVMIKDLYEGDWFYIAHEKRLLAVFDLEADAIRERLTRFFAR